MSNPTQVNDIIIEQSNILTNTSNKEEPNASENKKKQEIVVDNAIYAPTEKHDVNNTMTESNFEKMKEIEKQADDLISLMKDTHIDNLTTEQKKLMEQAVALAEKMNDKEKMKTEFLQNKDDIGRKLQEFKKQLKYLTLENAQKMFDELREFFVKIMETKNQFMINAVFAGYFSILLRYHFKSDLLDLGIVKNDDDFESFLPQEGFRTLIEQIISTFSSEDASMIRVQYINNLIFPELQYEFEKFLTEEQHANLVRFADAILKTKLNEYKKKYSVNVEKCNEAVEHLQEISKGNLPFDYVSERTVDYPYKKIDLLGMLNESNEQYYEKTITRDQFKKLQEIASERLEIYTRHIEHLREMQTSNNNKQNIEKDLSESNNEKLVADEQKIQKAIVHLKKIVDGIVPYEYKIFEDYVEEEKKNIEK